MLRVAVAVEQGLAIVGHVDRGQVEVGRSGVPPLLDPRADDGVGDGVGHGLVPAERPGIRQERVGAVEQPQLAGLEGPHVLDERRAGRLPGGATCRERPGEHPLRERLGRHRLGVVDPCLPRDLGSVVVGRPRRDAVDHRRHEGDVRVDPRGERVVDERGEVADDAGDHGAVVRHVVVGHDGDRPGTCGASSEQTGDELARGRRDDAGQRIRLQRSDVGADVISIDVEAAGGVAAVAGLGDGARDDCDGRVGEVPTQGVEVVRRVHGAEAGDDLGPRPAWPTDEERVETVLSARGSRRWPASDR